MTNYFELLTSAVETFKEEHRQGILLVNSDWLIPLFQCNILENKVEQCEIKVGNGQKGLCSISWQEIDGVPIIFSKFIDTYQVVDKINRSCLK
jgi:hypothetical protein